MKVKFKIGDKVYATENVVWGMKPMKVTAITEYESKGKGKGKVIIRVDHPQFGFESFNQDNLEKVTKSRTLRIQSLLKKKKALEKELNKLFKK